LKSRAVGDAKESGGATARLYCGRHVTVDLTSVNNKEKPYVRSTVFTPERESQSGDRHTTVTGVRESARSRRPQRALQRERPRDPATPRVHGLQTPRAGARAVAARPPRRSRRPTSPRLHQASHQLKRPRLPALAVAGAGAAAATSMTASMARAPPASRALAAAAPPTLLAAPPRVLTVVEAGGEAGSEGGASSS
jgi:hypothetical protein